MKNNQKPLIETLYGIIFIVPSNDSIRFFNKINPKWNDTPFQKRLFESIESLIKSNQNVDVINVINYFRQNNWFDSKLPLQLSNLTSGIFTTETMMFADSIFFELENQYMFKKAIAIRNQIDSLVENENLTIQKFHEIIESGKDVQIELQKTKSNVDVIFDIIDDSINAKNGIVSGMHLGYSQLKTEILIENVDVMVIGARPGMGKTAFAISTLIRLILMGKKIVFFSLEMSSKQIMRRIVSNIANIDSNRIKYGELTDFEMKQIYQVQEMQELNNLIIFDGTHSVNDIAAKLNAEQMKGSIDLWIVDYLQKIQPKNTRSRYDSVTEISNSIKLIAMNQKIPCIALAQLSRAVMDRGGDKRPILSDLKESGEIEQDASIVMFLHRPEYYGIMETYDGEDSTNKCELIIAKNRDGGLGIYEMHVNLKTSKFY